MLAIYLKYSYTPTYTMDKLFLIHDPAILNLKMLR